MFFSQQNLMATFYAGRRRDNSISSSGFAASSSAAGVAADMAAESGYHSVIRELTGSTQHFS
jgi:hypothetical protein